MLENLTGPNEFASSMTFPGSVLGTKVKLANFYGNKSCYLLLLLLLCEFLGKSNINLYYCCFCEKISNLLICRSIIDGEDWLIFFGSFSLAEVRGTDLCLGWRNLIALY